MPLETFLFALLGLVFGSFGNVILSRLHTGESLLGRSHCMHCRRTLGALDLVPVFSYALLAGRCRGCGRSISLVYPIVEILCGALFALAATVYASEPILAVLTSALFFFLLLATAFDALHQKLPDAFTLAIACIAFLLTILIGDIFSSVLGILLTLVWFGSQWVFSKGRAVGTGDIFLSSALALWLGFRGTVAMLILSYVTGSIVILLLLGLGVLTMKQKRIAFGPFLAIGALLSFLGVGQIWGL